MMTGILFSAFAMCAAAELPEVKLTGDELVVKKSCRIVIPDGTIIADAQNDGVIKIEASNITVEFVPGAILCGAAPSQRPDEYKGYAICVKGHKNVTLRNGAIRGYWCGIYAVDADGLTVENVKLSDMRRDRLRSTPASEDSSDWLWPHANDDSEWLKKYGAAICIEKTRQATIANCIIRHGQNALIFDNVSESRVYDNDFSFNSGWGIAMWRSCRNVISRNALDFNVRGYSHGVYNRGQDSAGILGFEQCSDNGIAENSATHCGDGFFGFAGKEALGQTPPPKPEFDYRRAGNNDNLLIDNDFSYAPAHGIEMTFSFGNRFIGNRLVGNAICGVWGGYSQDTLIAGNLFENNGERGYGLERGGVNIEHGRNNKVVNNTFRGNKCGVHYWWNPKAELLKGPWGMANEPVAKDNLIAGNDFLGEQVAFHFRGPTEVTIGLNRIENCIKEIDAAPEASILRDETVKIDKAETRPKYKALGEKRPVGARKHLAGRENIIMTEWGPWDHETPLVRLAESTGRARIYEFFRMTGDPQIELAGSGLRADWTPHSGTAPGRYEIRADEPGIYPYSFAVRAGDFRQTLTGTIMAAEWDAVFFKWDVDPREKLDEWRLLAEAPGAVHVRVDRMSIKYAFGGPGDQKLSPALTESQLGKDHFGMIAKTTLEMSAGRWKVSTLSDDGIRVTVDGTRVVEDWTWHAPKRVEGEFTLKKRKKVDIVVEHFEIDGYATLEFELGPAEPGS